MGMFKFIFVCLACMAINFNLFASNVETATKLTTLLRSARSVTVNKKTIGDPTTFDVAKFMKKTKKNYLRASGGKLDESDPMLKKLLTAIEYVITNAKAGKYSGKWTSGTYANKFLPARFARETGIKFGELTGGKATIKLTTSSGLLVNPSNKADTWENNIIEKKFLTKGWEKNKIFHEKTGAGFRLILPEYYKSGCLKCHGGDAGKAIHPSKKAGNLGDFGGAISVTLK